LGASVIEPGLTVQLFGRKAPLHAVTTNVAVTEDVPRFWARNFVVVVAFTATLAEPPPVCVSVKVLTTNGVTPPPPPPPFPPPPPLGVLCA
jgi:hypothetical protein